MYGDPAMVRWRRCSLSLCHPCVRYFYQQSFPRFSSFHFLIHISCVSCMLHVLLVSFSFFIIFLTFSKKTNPEALYYKIFWSLVISSLKSTYSLEHCFVQHSRNSPPLPLFPIFNIYLYFYVFVVLLITCRIEGEKTGGIMKLTAASSPRILCADDFSYT
jgi:hypothetical protein